MNRSFWILLVVTLITAGLLFSLPVVRLDPTSNAKPQKTATRDNPTTASASEPAMATTTEDAHKNELSAVQIQKSNELRNLYLKAADNSKKAKSAQGLSEYFQQIRQLDSAAHYAEVVALLEPTEKNYLLAGDRYYDAYSFAANEQKTKKLGEKTREWYQKVLDRNPQALVAKAQMAMTYVNSENPMQGIMMLREVIATDPTNELALFNLGLLSMRSNQYQKAVERFTQVTNNNPTNTKARFYLGVSLAQLGKNKEAIGELAKVKKIEKDPMILQAIDELEQQLK
jgi:tetratricopeptide (TPR) repeat protein